MPNLWELFEKISTSNIFKGIGLPSLLIVLQLIGKYISNRESSTLGLTRLFRFLSEDLHVGLCVISIGSVFYMGQIMKPEKSFVPTIGPFLTWILVVFIIFLVSCALARKLSRQRKEFFSFNTLIGMHVPNSLGAVSVFISYILYQNLGVLLN